MNYTGAHFMRHFARGALHAQTTTTLASMLVWVVSWEAHFAVAWWSASVIQCHIMHTCKRVEQRLDGNTLKCYDLSFCEHRGDLGQISTILLISQARGPHPRRTYWNKLSTKQSRVFSHRPVTQRLRLLRVSMLKLALKLEGSNSNKKCTRLLKVARQTNGTPNHVQHRGSKLANPPNILKG